MRFRSLPLTLAAATMLAGTALLAPAVSAAPVFVSPKTASGPVPTNTRVVLFSYDVRAVYPQVAARFEQWRPSKPSGPAPESTKLPLLPDWKDYHLMATLQLQEFPLAFKKAHIDDPEMLEMLMPRFEAIYEKHGKKPPSEIGTDLLMVESARQAWCRRVASEINAILVEYNGGYGPDAPNMAYERTLARWRGKRNEALRIAASKAGANPTISYVEGVTNARGTVNFDVPAGNWWVACQVGEWSWYKRVKISERGGHLELTANDAQPDGLALTDWTGD